MAESDPKNFLEELHKEKKTIEKYIRQLEESIIDNETKYLQNTVNGGNILRGWEHIFTSKSKFPHNINPIKKPKISNNERVFSQTNINNYYLRNDVIEVNNNNKNNDFGISSSQNNFNLNQRNLNNNNTNYRYKKKITQSLSLKKKKLNSGQKDKKIEILPI